MEGRTVTSTHGVWLERNALGLLHTSVYAGRHGNM